MDIDVTEMSSEELQKFTNGCFELLGHSCVTEKNPPNTSDPQMLVDFLVDALQQVNVLLVSVMVGNLNLTKKLISFGTDVNKGTHKDLGALALSLHHKHFDIASLLIKSGADVNKRDDKGRLPLYYAIHKDSPTYIVEELLLGGANIDSVISNNNDDTALKRAISLGNDLVVKFCLKNSSDVNFSANSISPLSYAIFYSNLFCNSEAVQLLLDHGANLEDGGSKECPPLLQAMYRKNIEPFKILLRAGADPNRVYNFSSYNITPSARGLSECFVGTLLHLAVIEKKLQPVKLLLEYGADVEATEPASKVTAAHMAFSMTEEITKEGRMVQRKIIELLLERGANVYARSSEGNTPIGCTTSSHNFIALEECIRSGINPNSSMCSEKGLESIFYYVVKQENVELAELCLQFGADHCSQDSSGVSAYEIAISNDCVPIVKLFWRYNHPCSSRCRNIEKTKNCRFANYIQQVLITSVVIKNVNRVKWVLNNGAEPNCYIKESTHVLHYAVDRCKVPWAKKHLRPEPKIVKLLLDHGVPPSLPNDDGLTPLHISVRERCLRSCKFLLQYGACFNHRSLQGDTPLILAKSVKHEAIYELLSNLTGLFRMARIGNKKVVERLKKILEESSNDFFCYINCMNRKGNTLLGEALESGYPEIANEIMILRLKTA